MKSNSAYCCRLVLQEKPFAAPLRLIAAGLDLHSLPLAPPPFKQEGSTCVPVVPGTDTHSTAAAQGVALPWHTVEPFAFSMADMLVYCLLCIAITSGNHRISQHQELEGF